MPDAKYTGSYIKKEAQGSSGPVSLSNSSSKKYYGKMIDAPGFKSGGTIRRTTKNIIIEICWITCCRFSQKPYQRRSFSLSKWETTSYV